MQKDFWLLTLFPLPQRQANSLKDRVQRKDVIFSFLAEKVFDYPLFLRVFKKKIDYWLSIDNSETVLALAGYIYYLDSNFVKAENFFYQCIDKNWDNLDNWIDLAFCLYHQCERKNNLAKGILFDFDIFIKKFININCKKINLAKLEEIYKKIQKEKKSYAWSYQKFVIS